jgi:branched-subunit amino acid transport protein
MSILDSLVTLNMVLVLLGTGIIIWVIRQVMPDPIEKMKVWRIVLRVLPVGIGAGLALLPGLRPLDDMVQSSIVGGVAGSLSANTYELTREALGARIKSVLGSPQARQKGRSDG